MEQEHFQVTGRPLSVGSEEGRIVLKPAVPWRERRSDLLLKGSLGGSGGGVGGGGLHRPVGHDAGGELLLGPLEAGARGAVQRVDLMGTSRLEGRAAVGRAWLALPF